MTVLIKRNDFYVETFLQFFTVCITQNRKIAGFSDTVNLHSKRKLCNTRDLLNLRVVSSLVCSTHG